jgi:intracellular multiplication protein IcmB
MEGSVPRLSEIVTMLIESLYQRFADDGEPNIYERGYSKLVDAALEKFDIRMPDGATWWQVVDRLFEVGDTHSAGIAQTFAVPLLSDATTVLSSDHKIRDVYGSAQINGESLINFLNGMIVAAVKDYPLLSAPTTFDPSGARVVSIDLQDVAKGGGDQANKRTAIVYMFARQATCREFYRSKDTLSEIPERYRSYHAAQIEADAAAPKKICMDEFHRTAKAQSVRDQAIIDIREGRKFGVHITILSQDLQDFSDEIVKMSNNVWILSKGLAETTTDEIQKTFKPSPDAMTALRRHVTGPGREGSTLLYLGDIKGGGRVEQVLRLTLGPREIWAYSTTAVDVALRGAIAEQVGLPRALNVLAERFPDGSAQSYLEQRGLESDDDEEAGSELIKAVARELVAEVRKTARG